MTARQWRRVAHAFHMMVVVAAMGLPLVVTPSAEASTPANLPPLISYHGAIAYSPDGSSGIALRRKTRTSAEGDSLSQCGVSTCTIVSSFLRCGAVAHDGSVYHGGHGPSRGHAEAHAIQRLGGGWIVKSVCN